MYKHMNAERLGMLQHGLAKHSIRGAMMCNEIDYAQSDMCFEDRRR